jgi:hypothetical protein
MYGVTINGGTIGYGIAYQLKPPTGKGHTWTERILHDFSMAEGTNINYGVVMDSAGALYGTASANVFELVPPATPGGAWTERSIMQFTGANGADPNALAFDNNGVLTGTAFGGGAHERGVVFQLTPPASPGGAWTEAILYEFQGGNDGTAPDGLVFYNGQLYGATAATRTTYGTIFQLTPPATPEAVGGALDRLDYVPFARDRDISL